ncbi:MAG: hypothetical protein R6V76_15325 [Desulfobacterales bacterium]
MKLKKNKPVVTGNVSGVMKGTTEMGYWDFRKEICNKKGWQLRRTEPQTYEVLNSEKKKIGIFKSRNGFFPISIKSK